jgi:hypothetical protein
MHMLTLKRQTYKEQSDVYCFNRLVLAANTDVYCFNRLVLTAYTDVYRFIIVLF